MCLINMFTLFIIRIVNYTRYNLFAYTYTLSSLDTKVDSHLKNLMFLFFSQFSSQKSQMKQSLEIWKVDILCIQHEWFRKYEEMLPNFHPQGMRKIPIKLLWSIFCTWALNICFGINRILNCRRELKVYVYV